MTASFHVYQVLRDHNRHTCICVGVERKYSYFVPMDALEVEVRHMSNDEFAHEYEVIPEYPVRRAAEIYLAAPDKLVSPKAREHLERILADPAYVYDSSLFTTPHVLKEKEMATATAKAASKAKKPKGLDKETAAAANAMIAANATPVSVKAGRRNTDADTPTKTEPVGAKRAAKKAATSDAAPRGRKPALDPQTRLKVGSAEGVRGGFMLEFLEKSRELEKGSRGKGFTIEAIVDALTTAEHEASWVRTYVTYSLDPKRGIFVLA